MHFDIIPFEKCGPLTWKMKPDEVNDILGVPDKSSRNGAGNLVQYRNGRSLSLIFDRAMNTLIELACSRVEPVLMLGGVTVNAPDSESVVRALLERDELALQGSGSIVFPNLGVALTGYVPQDYYIRAASVFARGRWDEAASDMKPFRPKRRK